MLYEFRSLTLLRWGLCTTLIFGIAGGCSSKYHKSEADKADKEVYKIIDSKWQDSFGQKANYIISDAPPSPNDIQIENAPPPSGVISLAQAVAMATAHNREYQTKKEDLYKRALSLTGERYNYALQWFGTIEGKYAKSADTEDVSVGTKGNAGSEGIGFRKTQLLASGIRISANLAVKWLRFLTGDPRMSLGSVLSASVTVPLLGAGAGKADWENLTQAERNVLYTIRTFNRYRKTFVVTIAADYYGVLQKKDAVTNAENNHKRVVESRDRLEMEAEAGRKTRIDVDEAEQNVLKAQDGYVQAQQSYEQQLDRFKIKLALPTDANVVLEQNELKALEKIGVSEPNYALDTMIETALHQRLDLANTRDKTDDAARKVKLAAEGLGPQLNLTGSTEVTSKERTELSNLQFNRGTYGLGLDAVLFHGKTERNAYRETLITLEQQQRKYDNDVEEVKLNVRLAYRQLLESAERHKISKMSLDLAEKRVESNELLLDAGRGTTRVLLLSQGALLRAQNDVTAALINHLNAKLRFFRDVGILQVRPDGMWEQRTPQSAISELADSAGPDGMREEEIAQSAISELMDLVRPDGM